MQSGDTVRVHQYIREGNKQRVQVFEGVIIRTDRLGSSSASITVRRIASGVGVEKTFLLHSPNLEKVEVMRRGRVRRNFISFLRDRRGKSARLKEVALDRTAVNVQPVKDEVPAEDPIADAEVTELDTEETQQVEAEVSTEEVAKEENQEAGSDEPKSTDGDGDESVMEQEEAESGVDRADAEEEKAASKE